MSKAKISPLRRAAQNKAREYRNNHIGSQGGQAVGILSMIFGAAAAIGGAITFPILWGTNFGVGFSMMLTGGVTCGLAGVLTPPLLNKIFSSTAAQYLKPSTYKEARTLKKAEQPPAPSPK